MFSTRNNVMILFALLVLSASTVVIASGRRNDHSKAHVAEQHTATLAVSHSEVELPCHDTTNSQAVEGPCTSVGQPAGRSHSIERHHAPHTHSSPRAGHANKHLSHADLARFDMSAYAAHHFGTVAGQEHTYGSTTEWSKGWSYHWMDFSRNGEIVRVCHATKNDDLHHRYVSAWDPSHFTWSGWEQVR